MKPEDLVRVRLVIATPTREYVPASFAQDLAELYHATVHAVPVTFLLMLQATYVHEGRERLLQTAIEKLNATHVLWLDSDMRFPRTTVLQLLRHDLAFVACNCTTRVIPARPTSTRNGELVYTHSTSTGLEEVDKVGLAVALMRTEVVRDLPQPWFRYGWNETTRGNIGEDTAFCHRLRGANRRIFIDHDLSKEISHTGLYHFGHSDVLAEVHA